MKRFLLAAVVASSALLAVPAAKAATIDVTVGTFGFSFNGTTLGTGASAVSTSSVTAPGGVMSGGSIILNTDLASYDTDGIPSIVSATFGTSAVSAPDFSVYDSYGSLLFAGDFVSLNAFGFAGTSNLGLSGTTVLTAGSIFGLGAGSTLITTFTINAPSAGLPSNAFVKDVLTQFSGTATATFSGDAGTAAAPEPSTLLLLGTGVLGLSGLRSFRARIRGKESAPSPEMQD